ncbi:MAG: hypothetical protein HGA19_05610 [Oscillochloris sp.]|nr:hypothetical protein [Oscillochloris sp.]
MQRKDIPPDALAYIEYCNAAETYLYYAREWFFEGTHASNGRTAVVIFTHLENQACRRFGAMNFWVNNDRTAPVRRVTLFDEEFPCSDLDRILHRLIRHGILEITNQGANYSTAQVSDLIGVQAKLDQQNWYSLIGSSHHTDRRHEKYILPFFLGKLGLEPYLKAINNYQL